MPGGRGREMTEPDWEEFNIEGCRVKQLIKGDYTMISLEIGHPRAPVIACFLTERLGPPDHYVTYTPGDQFTMLVWKEAKQSKLWQQIDELVGKTEEAK